MAQWSEPPVGVTAIAVIVALSGVTSLVRGVQVVALGETAPGLLNIVIGLLLCHRAYLIYRLTRGAYLITVILLGLRALLAAVDLFFRTLAIESAIGLIVALVALLYLVQPGVRALFSADHR